jgi:SP family general alpha glucoside:H+ symporter-like MFS transporter
MSGKHNKDEHQIEVADDLDVKEEITHYEGGKEEYAQHSTLLAEALAQREEESKMGLWKVFKLYYPGATYGLLLSVALVMEGYDTGLVSSFPTTRPRPSLTLYQINNFFGQKSFLTKFGSIHPGTGKLLVPADWQAGVNNAASGGQIIGLLINGWAQTKYGYRTVYMIGMVAMASCIFVLFFAVNIEMILVGNLLAGIPWGIFQVITTAYASEVVPPALRGVSRSCMQR